MCTQQLTKSVQEGQHASPQSSKEVSVMEKAWNTTHTRPSNVFQQQIGYSTLTEGIEAHVKFQETVSDGALNIWKNKGLEERL